MCTDDVNSIIVKAGGGLVGGGSVGGMGVGLGGGRGVKVTTGTLVSAGSVVGAVSTVADGGFAGGGSIPAHGRECKEAGATSTRRHCETYPYHNCFIGCTRLPECPDFLHSKTPIPV